MLQLMWSNRFLTYENRLGVRPAMGLGCAVWQSGSVDFVVAKLMPNRWIKSRTIQEK